MCCTQVHRRASRSAAARCVHWILLIAGRREHVWRPMADCRCRASHATRHASHTCGCCVAQAAPRAGAAFVPQLRRPFQTTSLEQEPDSVSLQVLHAAVHRLTTKDPTLLARNRTDESQNCALTNRLVAFVSTHRRCKSTGNLACGGVCSSSSLVSLIAERLRTLPYGSARIARPSTCLCTLSVDTALNRPRHGPYDQLVPAMRRRYALDGGTAPSAPQVWLRSDIGS